MGDPPHDGSPAIDSPRFVMANVVRFLDSDDRVPGVNRNTTAKAYPKARATK
ncbi:MAG: DUF3179 domain-containing protein [Gammaproteobacteria bacterium]|nr:DUF3179 domain-containing protein [Gammaproteobacteria bacterium]